MYVGTAETVGDLVEILLQPPQDKKVRTATLSHVWPPEVHDRDDYVTVDAG